MAQWDSADLLQQLKDLLARPAVDSVFTDPMLYRFLTKGEAFWKRVLAAHAPAEMWVGPYLMRSVDDKVFVFGDIVINGDFSLATGWTLGGTWAIAGGLADTNGFTSASISQTPTIPLIAGLEYEVEYTISAASGGDYVFTLGGTAGTQRSGNGTHTERIICGTGTTYSIGPATVSSIDVNLDDVKVKLPTNPLRVQFIKSLTAGPLKPGQFWDASSDYVVEDGQIRITRGGERTYEDGAPYIRFVPPAGIINATTEPTTKPIDARVLVVNHAAVLAASRGGGLRDPSYFQDLEDQAWDGVPERGISGIRDSLKTQDHMGGLAAVQGGAPFKWWKPNG